GCRCAPHSSVKEMSMRRTRWLIVLAGLAAAGAAEADDPHPAYPKTRRVDQVDVYHGVKVADPYRWLEDDVREAPERVACVEAENKVTDAYLKAIPQREPLRRRLTDLWNYEKSSAPFKAGGRYFFFKNDGLQNQFVLYAQDRLDAEPHVLIDPNAWSKDGTVSLGNVSASDDGKYLAYSKSESGSDWSTWHVLDVASARPLSGRPKGVR